MNTNRQLGRQAPRPRRDPLRTWRLTRLAIGLVVALGGAAVVLTMLHSPRHQEPTGLTDFSDLCASRPIPGAAAYVPGAGVHPVAVFANERDDVTGQGGRPVVFDPPSEVYNPGDVSRIQLVACTEVSDDIGQVGTCPFSGTTARELGAVVELGVYEARIGDQVGETITKNADSTECPRSVWSRVGSEPTVYTTPTESQYAAHYSPSHGDDSGGPRHAPGGGSVAGSSLGGTVQRPSRREPETTDRKIRTDSLSALWQAPLMPAASLARSGRPVSPGPSQQGHQPASGRRGRSRYE